MKKAFHYLTIFLSVILLISFLVPTSGYVLAQDAQQKAQAKEIAKRLKGMQNDTEAITAAGSLLNSDAAAAAEVFKLTLKLGELSARLKAGDAAEALAVVADGVETLKELGKGKIIGVMVELAGIAGIYTIFSGGMDLGKWLGNCMNNNEYTKTVNRGYKAYKQDLMGSWWDGGFGMGMAASNQTMITSVGNLAAWTEIFKGLYGLESGTEARQKAVKKKMLILYFETVYPDAPAEKFADLVVNNASEPEIEAAVLDWLEGKTTPVPPDGLGNKTGTYEQIKQYILNAKEQLFKGKITYYQYRSMLHGTEVTDYQSLEKIRRQKIDDEYLTKFKMEQEKSIASAYKKLDFHDTLTALQQSVVRREDEYVDFVRNYIRSYPKDLDAQGVDESEVLGFRDDALYPTIEDEVGAQVSAKESLAALRDKYGYKSDEEALREIIRARLGYDCDMLGNEPPQPPKKELLEFYTQLTKRYETYKKFYQEQLKKHKNLLTADDNKLFEYRYSSLIEEAKRNAGILSYRYADQPYGIDIKFLPGCKEFWDWDKQVTVPVISPENVAEAVKSELHLSLVSYNHLKAEINQGTKFRGDGWYAITADDWGPGGIGEAAAEEFKKANTKGIEIPADVYLDISADKMQQDSALIDGQLKLIAEIEKLAQEEYVKAKEAHKIIKEVRELTKATVSATEKLEKKLEPEMTDEDKNILWAIYGGKTYRIDDFSEYPCEWKYIDIIKNLLKKPAIPKNLTARYKQELEESEGQFEQYETRLGEIGYSCEGDYPWSRQKLEDAIERRDEFIQNYWTGREEKKACLKTLAEKDNGDDEDQAYLPVINSFTANPTSISAGDSSTLSWDVSGAKSVSIDHGVGIVSASGNTSAKPSVTTIYTLTAANAAGNVTYSITVTVAEAPQPPSYKPVINSFTASPASISAGGSSTLSWSVSGAKSVSLDQGVGQVPASGSVTKKLYAATTYTLTASNDAGNVTNSVTVTVAAAPASKPVINSFTASPTSISAGGSSTLSWSVSGATSVIIGGTTVPAQENGTVEPTATTTYMLTASNDAGSVSKSVTVTVAAAPSYKPVINSFTASPTSISAGGSSTLSWSVSGATSVIIGSTPVPAQGSSPVGPTATTIYTLTASNDAGSVNKSVTVTVAEAPSYKPVINSFTASPTSISAGGSSTLSWSVSGATFVIIGSTSVPAQGSSPVGPTATTIYTLTASNDAGSVNKSVTVTVAAAPSYKPVINSFTASPTSISAGGSSTLSWSVSGATSVIIGSTPVPAQGSSPVGPTATTIYTLTASNDAGSVNKSVTVTVAEAPSYKPVINSFTASPTSISAGGSSTLSWSVSGATFVIIGSTSVPAQGSSPVGPTATTIYTLTASNDAGSVTKSVTVTVSGVQPKPPLPSGTASLQSEIEVLGGFSLEQGGNVGMGDADFYWHGDGIYGDMIDLGTGSLGSITTVPTSGYEGFIAATPGHVYAAKTRNGKYGIIQVTNTSSSWLEFMWKYQPDGTNSFW